MPHIIVISSGKFKIIPRIGEEKERSAGIATAGRPSKIVLAKYMDFWYYPKFRTISA
jgi:hypothetical protein